MTFCELTVSRTIPAAPDAVFDAWIDPASPGSPWYGSERAIVNPVVDGLFYHSVEHEGKNWAHYGRFERLDRPHRIEHTWMSEATRGCESVVTVTMEPRGDQTQVTLRHTGVPDDELGRQHEKGWSWILSSLADRFAQREASTP